MRQSSHWFRNDDYPEIEHDYYTIDRVIRALQERLDDEGYRVGAVDGKIGALTMRAFSAWLMREISTVARVSPEFLAAGVAIREGRVRPGQRLPLVVWSVMASVGLQEIFDEMGPYPIEEPQSETRSVRQRWIVRGQTVPVYRGRTVPTMPASWGPSGQVDDDQAPTLSTDPSNTEEMAVVAPTRNAPGGTSTIQRANQSFFVKHQTPILVGGAVLLAGGLAYLLYARSNAS